jgi:acetyl-CoA carboxylase biotin carboxyl carrier protein
VSVGAQVGPTSTVCLVEAMKIFNEIKAERSGTVAKILVKSGDAVEFGQPLFMIRPS